MSDQTISPEERLRNAIEGRPSFTDASRVVVPGRIGTFAEQTQAYTPGSSRTVEQRLTEARTEEERRLPASAYTRLREALEDGAPPAVPAGAHERLRAALEGRPAPRTVGTAPAPTVLDERQQTGLDTEGMRLPSGRLTPRIIS